MSVADSANEAHRPGDEERAPTVLDPVATVRLHPEWYFRRGRFDRDEAASLLVGEALRGGAKHVTVRTEGDWVTVYGDIDWLDGDVAAFVSPQAYAEGGQNSSRIEVALVAFCRAVATSTADGPLMSWSTDGEDVVMEGLNAEDLGRGRLVAFMSPDEPSVPRPASQSDESSRHRLRLVPNEGRQRILSAVESFVQKQQRAP